MIPLFDFSGTMSPEEFRKAVEMVCEQSGDTVVNRRMSPPMIPLEMIGYPPSFVDEQIRIDIEGEKKILDSCMDEQYLPTPEQRKALFDLVCWKKAK